MKKRAGVSSLKKLNKTRGASLGEMLVCVLLFSVVSLMSITGLFYAYGATDNVKTVMDSQTVGDMLLNRIEGELTGMSENGRVYLLDDGNNDLIGFVSSSGIPILIGVNDGVNYNGEVPGGLEDNGKYQGSLLIRYRETIADGTTFKASNWHFDTESFKGYQLTRLTFSPQLHGKRLIVEVHMEIKAPGGKVYSFTRAVCCYNKELSVLYDGERGVDVTTFTSPEVFKKDGNSENPNSYWGSVSSS